MMKRNPIPQIISVVLFIGLIAVPSIPVSGDTTKVACVGDSITWGWGLSNRNHESYPAVLQTLLGSQYIVMNCGTSGCTMLKRGDMPYWNDANLGASTEFKPDIVVIILGSNDAKPQNWSHKSDFITDYHSMIEHYRGLGARVYIASPPPVYHGGRFGITPAVVNDQIVPLVRQVAANANVKLIDVFTALSGKPGYFPDTVHPNADGSRLIAQTVAASLTSNPVIQTSTPAATQTSNTPRTVIAVNCGGGSFTSSDGIEYAADTAYSGGSTYSSDAAISGTTDDALYQSERYGNATYSITVPNGHYRVTLHFAETYHAGAGLRRFDVVMEGTQCISGLDIYAKAGGNAAYTTETNVNVGDGELNIEFVPSVENPKISAIKVVLDGLGASFIAVPDMPVQGQTITFDASASNNPKGTITAYSWEFGDGGKATGVTASHSYSTAGEHKVTLKVTGSGGDSGSLTNAVKVYTGEPFADFSKRPSAVKPGEKVTVDASASFDIDGTIRSYRVDYGDGHIVKDAVTAHTYPNEGKYEITVTVTDNDGKTDTLSRGISVRNIDESILKPRIVVLTDISTWETDDHESMTRLLAHADLFEIEALVMSTGYSLPRTVRKDFINIIHDVINAYEKDLPNLMKRSNQDGHDFDDTKQEIGYWPSACYLRERTLFGSLVAGKNALGSENDSPGSNLIIELADKTDDPRPIWVTVWGGGPTLAQSIWRVKQDRSAEELKAFLNKVRIYTITDQDVKGAGGSTHPWMRSVAGSDLLFIWDECAWKRHNGTGKRNWSEYATHIQGHGALGGQYPKNTVGVEGDTPSFLYLMPTGLNDPDDPSQCSWAGTYREDSNNLWREAHSCGSYFDRFYPAAFNNFAARMDWAKDGAGNRNPVLVLEGDDGISVLTMTPRQGATVTLDASDTWDPDGDHLTFNWWIQSDAGSYPGEVSIANSSSSIATVSVPSDSAGKSFHVICEVIDDGAHNLSDYRRIIFEPTDKDAAQAEASLEKANPPFKFEPKSDV